MIANSLYIEFEITLQAVALTCRSIEVNCSCESRRW